MKVAIKLRVMSQGGLSSFNIACLMDWREVIHRYLSAGIADSRQIPPTTTSRAQFIDEFGTTALICRELHNQTQSDKRVASQQVPAPETYKAIEESPMRVLAEVDKANVLELFCPTRFLVVKVDNQWKLDDIFWKCTCNNGVCIICQGIGHCSVCHGRGFTWQFFGFVKQGCYWCEGKPNCTHCNGTGRCDHCTDSPVRGWTSRTKIILDDDEGG